MKIPEAKSSSFSWMANPICRAVEGLRSNCELLYAKSMLDFSCHVNC